MRIIYNKIIPIKGFGAMNIFGIMFVRKGYPVTDRVINHERIHTAQMKEMLYILFYVFYLIEWLFLLIKYRNVNKAYYNIRFEKEAYGHDTDYEYLKKRKQFAWIKY